MKVKPPSRRKKEENEEDIEEKNEEIAASIPRDGRLTMSVPASERDSRKRAPGGFCGRTTLSYPIVSPGALMQQEVSPRPTMKGAATRACALRALWCCARRAHAAARTRDRHESWRHGIGWNRDAASAACTCAFRLSCRACGSQALLAGGLKREVRDCTWALSLVRGL